VQYLFTEQVHTSKFRLVLNKLLCGVAYNDAVATGYRVQEGDLPKKQVPQKNKCTTNTNPKESAQPADVLPLEIDLLHQNCQKALELAIERWKSLATLTQYEEYKKGFGVEELRRYFFNRQRILHRVETKQACYWHLPFPLEAYDSAEIPPP
jgi:hypothetical protein